MLSRTRSRAAGGTILYSFQESSLDENDYLRSVLPRDESLTPRYFSWRVALAGRYEVFHLHWPELLLSDRSRLRSVGKAVLLILLLGRLVVLRIPIVRTVHNLRPHDEVGRLLLGAEKVLGWVTSVRIYINESTENFEAPGVTILHSAYNSARLRKPEREGLISFGLVRRYKGLTDLVDAYADWLPPGDRPRLRIVGMAADEHYAEELRSRSAQVPGVELFLEFLPRDTLEDLVRSSAGAVLPYRSVYNSGALWFALSQCTPVLVPKSAATMVLEQEFGRGWVRTYKDELTPADLELLLQSEHNYAVLQAGMKRREPATVSALHSELYRFLIDRGWASRSVPRLRSEVLGWVGAQREFVAHSSRNSASSRGERYA